MEMEKTSGEIHSYHFRAIKLTFKQYTHVLTNTETKTRTTNLLALSAVAFQSMSTTQHARLFCDIILTHFLPASCGSLSKH